MLLHTLRSLLRFSPSTRHHRAARRPRLTLEKLEDRAVPSATPVRQVVPPAFTTALMMQHVAAAQPTPAAPRLHNLDANSFGNPHLLHPTSTGFSSARHLHNLDANSFGNPHLLHHTGTGTVR